MKIVTSTDAMTAEWFNSLLGEAGLLEEAKVASVEVEPAPGGAFSRMVRAKVTYEGETCAPSSLVLKVPTDDQGSLGLALAMGMYELEVRFYRDVAPLLTGMGIPRCFGAEIDPESGLFNLALEDLTGIAAPLQLAGPDGAPLEGTASRLVDACDSALAELVKFQAPLWNSPLISRLEWLADPRRAVGMFDAMALGLDGFLARFGHSLDPVHVTFFETYLPRAGEWVRGWQPPTVVQHGDFRSDNLMVGAVPGARPLTVIDFQTVRLGPPGVDPAYLVGSTLPTEDRQIAERDLVTGYHEKLRAAGVEGFGFDDCWRAYRAGALYGAFMFVGIGAHVESTEYIDRLIASQARRYADMAIDLEAPQAAGLS